MYQPFENHCDIPSSTACGSASSGAQPCELGMPHQIPTTFSTTDAATTHANAVPAPWATISRCNASQASQVTDNTAPRSDAAHVHRIAGMLASTERAQTMRQGAIRSVRSRHGGTVRACRASSGSHLNSSARWAPGMLITDDQPVHAPRERRVARSSRNSGPRRCRESSRRRGAPRSVVGDRREGIAPSREMKIHPLQVALTGREVGSTTHGARVRGDFGVGDRDREALETGVRKLTRTEGRWFRC